MSDLVERLRAAYEKVELFPERRMAPDAVLALGAGFMDLLELRNLTPEAADRIAALEAENARLKTEVADLTTELGRYERGVYPLTVKDLESYRAKAALATTQEKTDDANG